MVAEASPPAWQIALPDLRSRLSASLVARFEQPDAELLLGLVRRQLERRHIDVRDDTLGWIVERIPRSYIGVERAVDALEQATIAARRRLSIPFARATLIDACLIDTDRSAREEA